MGKSESIHNAALARSMIYRGFAEAFRDPQGGLAFFQEDLIPLPPKNASQAFVEAFDTAASANACSLHESDYSTREQMSLFEELVRWHEHFGLRRADNAELPDHISAELEFMHFLTYREHAQDHDEQAKSALRRAQYEFLERHLLPFSEKLRDACTSTSPRYMALARHLPEFLASEFKSLGS